MTETLTSSRPMRAKIPVTIFTVLFIILAILGLASHFIIQVGWYGGSYSFYVPSSVSDWIYILITLSVVIMFSIYVFRGKSEPSAMLPIVCGLYGSLEFVYMLAREVEYGYDDGSWAFGFLMIPAFVLVMICALSGFNKKVLFAIMLGLGGTIYFAEYSFVLDDIEWFFLSFYNFMSLCGIIAPFAFFIALFIFGIANRTIDPVRPPAPSIPGVPTAFIPPVIPSAPSIPGVPKMFVPPMPIAPVAPVQPEPVQAEPIYTAPVQPEPAPVYEEKKATASPEQMLAFWKDSFDKGMISEAEYKQKRDQIIREYF